MLKAKGCVCNILLKQAVREGKIPFEIATYTPNKTAIAAMRESEKIVKDPKVKGYKTAKEMFKDLGV